HDETRVVAIARADAASSAVAHGIAAASPNIARKVDAHVGGNTSDGVVRPQNVTLTATAHEDLLGFAAGSASADEVELNASIVAFRMDSDVEAYITQGDDPFPPASVVSARVQLTADHVTDVLGLAGAYASSPFAGIGAAVHANLLTKNVKAHIDPDAIVQSSNDVVINASSEDNFHSLLSGSSISAFSPMSIAASVAFTFLERFTHAFINGATVKADGNILLHADSYSEFDPLAGAQALS